jgi:DME family drug/metabolite transporter
MNVGVAAAGATVTAFVAGLYAVTAAALAIPVLGEPLERSTLLALLAALIGTVLLSGIRLETDTVVGIGSALIAAAAFGTYLVLSRRWGESHGLRGPLVGLSTLTISGIVAAVAVQLTGAPVVPAAPRPEALVAIAWLAVGPSATAAVLVVAGMQRLEARHASVFLLLNPPTAAILAYLLLGERLSALQLVGGACVLVAIAAASGLVVLRDRRR